MQEVKKHYDTNLHDVYLGSFFEMVPSFLNSFDASGAQPHDWSQPLDWSVLDYFATTGNDTWVSNDFTLAPFLDGPDPAGTVTHSYDPWNMVDSQSNKSGEKGNAGI